MREKNGSASIVKGSLLAKNTLWNLLGQIVPLVAALVAIPILIRHLGNDRFGMLTLIWLIISYFNIMDLGLGRALTQLVAEKIGTEGEQEVSRLIWTALFIMSVFGSVGALLLILICPWLVHSVLNIPDVLQSESLTSFIILAGCVPIVICTAGLDGILSAKQRFDLINGIRLPLGVFMYVGPLLVLPFSISLIPVTVILASCRLLALVVDLILCFRILPVLRRLSMQLTSAKQLLRFGSWMTITNIVGPMMVRLDRFIIGATISVTAVAYYATPYQAITKLWVLPMAVVTVLFPAFAFSHTRDPGRMKLLFEKSVKYIFLIMFPITFVVVAFAHEGLSLWLGKDFADNGYYVLQWLTLGVFLNSLAQVPYTLIQGAGRPDLTAKLHIVELPFYLVAVWWAIGSFGIEGAAFVWFIRISIDTFLMFIVASYFILEDRLKWRPKIYISFACAGFLMIVAMYLPSALIIKIMFVSGIFVAFLIASWLFFLSSEERAFMQQPRRLVHALK